MSSMSDKALKCPLCGSRALSVNGKISTKEIILDYNNRLGIDVSSVFKNLEEVTTYHCRECDYKFYYPFDLMGSDQFYAELSRKEWYYLPWKWEHLNSLNYIEDGFKLLEVGCGRGDYLRELKKHRKVEVTGLELNHLALEGNEDLDIRLESIQEHASLFPDSYDFVCSYQVLEHLSFVEEIISAMTTCLKPGGQLLISVPNNDGFIGKNAHPGSFLNMPPHHMGLWGENSLKSLERYFPLKLKSLVKEPLQKIHYGPYHHTYLKSLFNGFSLPKSIYFRLRLHKLAEFVMSRRASKIIGHSIIAVYTKA